MNRKVKVALIGAGNRGKNVYAKYLKVFNDRAELVAVADVDSEKVDEVRSEYGIADNMCFSSGEALLEQPKLADVILLCTMDHQHFDLAKSAIEKGYHLLLEKPISPDLDECRELERLALLHKRHVLVCHVLRYAPLYTKLKEILNSNTIGKIVSIQAAENIGYYHFAHSFVRGNWRNSKESNPMIMQKCCHDMDIMLWLTDKHCESVSSYGSLSYFKSENAPSGAAERCYMCRYNATCPFSAEKIYIDSPDTGIAHGIEEWASMFVVKPTPEKVREELKTNLFGRCVWHCDNDVADHQVVNLLMEDGLTVSFHVCAATNSLGRTMHLCGTEGDIYTNTDTQTITVQRFGEKPSVIDVNSMCLDLSGHGGGDRKLIEDMINIVGGSDGSGLTEITRSVESHYMAFAAEKSRINNGQPVKINDLKINAVEM